MKLFALASLFALLCCSAPAQTFTQKPGSVTCRVATYECQNIPMTSGDSYTINEPNSRMFPGYAFDWDTTTGVVEQVTQQPPSFSPGTYPFSLTFSLSDGRSGTVSGTIVITKPGRFPYASVENSTVTFN